jgi:hypothetical protein
MLCTVCDQSSDRGAKHIHCAKRSSAALRSAVNFEEKMEGIDVEQLPVSSESCERVLCERGSASVENGVAARVRRDSKNALEQRSNALACGEEAMVRICLLGKVVRVYGEWFALCSYCAAVIKVTPMHRFGGELCCKRCDAEMLGMPAPKINKQDLATFCRFCGRENSGPSVWRTIKAPLDVSRRNSARPPPLRSVTYCSTHFRPWLVGAHRVMPTRIILSHIAHGAKPVFQSSSSRLDSAGDLGFDDDEKEVKRRGKRGKRAVAGVEGMKKNGGGDGGSGGGSGAAV